MSDTTNTQAPPVPSCPEQKNSIPDWLSPVGLAAAAMASAAATVAYFDGSRWLAIALTGTGLAGALIGIVALRGKGRVSIAVGGLLSAATLSLAVFAPAVLNSFWAPYTPPPETDANRMVVVPHAKAHDLGRPLAKDEWVNAETEWIKQDDLLVQLHSVNAGKLPEKDGQTFLIVNMRLIQFLEGRKVAFERFVRGDLKPKLTDPSGRQYAFLSDRTGRPILNLDHKFAVDQLLIFELPPTQVEFLRLELPASAWGREGTCRFQIRKVVHEPTPNFAKQIADVKAIVLNKSAPPPDRALGRAHFAKHCVECHTLFSPGTKVGPNLTESKRGDLDFLLTSIIDPSAVIEKKYVPTVILTTSGMVHTGFLQKADAESVTLQVVSKTVVVPRDEIEEMRESKISIMPTDQLKDLSEHDVRSLIAYLQGKEQSPILATPDNTAYYFFFGDDLSNWRPSKTPWTVEKGAIVAPGPVDDMPARLTSGLHLANDFRMVLQFHPGKEGSGAILIRDVTQPGSPKVVRIGLSVGEPLAVTGVAEDHVTVADEGSEIQADNWNKLEMIVSGNSIQLRLNNKDAVTVADIKMPPRCAIELEGPSDAEKDFRFRNLALHLIPEQK